MNSSTRRLRFSSRFSTQGFSTQGLSAIAALAAFLLASSAASVQAKPTPVKAAPAPASYEKAQKELPKDLYVLYRIVDRLARANGLDERPWRIALVPKYEINAFATDVNLIAVYSGILDQLAGDTSAVACVVGHEMGHNVKRHVAVGEAERAALIEQAKKEAEAEVGREVNSAKAEATATSVAGGLLGGVVGSVLQGASNRRIETANARIPEIVKKKQQELDQRIAETNRKQELEADEAGYLYAAKAGFEPEGCLRAMAVLARTPGAEFDTDHPAVPKRIEALKQLMSKYPAASLAAEGKSKVSATKPLSYDLSKDGISLRINSRFGGSSNSDLDRLFGK